MIRFGLLLLFLLTLICWVNGSALAQSFKPQKALSKQSAKRLVRESQAANHYLSQSASALEHEEYALAEDCLRSCIKHHKTKRVGSLARYLLVSCLCLKAINEPDQKVKLQYYTEVYGLIASLLRPRSGLPKEYRPELLVLLPEVQQEIHH